MKLYVVEIYDYYHDEEWSTVNIWKTRESAEDAIEQYIRNYRDAGTLIRDSMNYRIVEIDTDVERDCIYDVVDENED